jgi:riboflavin biosynthesis pyrimidine reductase
VQQFLKAGLVDEIQIHVTPLVVESPAATHRQYRVVR